MNRLTYKLNNQEQEEHKTKYLKFEYFPIPDYCLEKGNSGRITSDMIYNKLGQLEDLEDELCCPLEVIINACINGFIAKYYGDWENEELNVNNRDIVVDFKRKCFTDNYVNEYFWKDYKKTWWLKEDKSE